MNKSMLFKTQPADFKKEIDVVVCYVEHDGSFILPPRQPYKTHGGKWGLPAGKVDAGETVSRAMAREIFEETGIEIPENDLVYFRSIFVRNEGHDFDYHMFLAKVAAPPGITINPKEHQGYVWASPSEARKMDLIHDLDECIGMFYFDDPTVGGKRRKVFSGEITKDKLSQFSINNFTRAFDFIDRGMTT